MLVDSHAHLDTGAFDGDRREVLNRALECGVGIIVNVGLDLESSRASLELAERYPQLFAALGFHPHNAIEMKESDLAQLKRLCHHKKVIAIGETGLDFYRKLSPPEIQVEAFKSQLRLAQELGLPVIVHSRNAEQETLEILTDWAQGQNGRPLGVLHCFGGNATLAQRFLELGFMLSIAGPVTYPSSRAAQVVGSLPEDRFLVETDCPFLAPHPQRLRRNEPSFLPIIVHKIAEIRKATPEAIAQATTQNAVRLFGGKENFAGYF